MGEQAHLKRRDPNAVSIVSMETDPPSPSPGAGLATHSHKQGSSHTNKHAKKRRLSDAVGKMTHSKQQRAKLDPTGYVPNGDLELDFNDGVFIQCHAESCVVRSALTLPSHTHICRDVVALREFSILVYTNGHDSAQRVFFSCTHAHTCRRTN